ncbi:MAG: IS21 family transposase, partial [Flavobacterium sp.]
MKIKEISNSRIASSLGISRTTLIKYVDNICKSGLSFGELDKLSEKDLADLFHTPNLLTEIKNDKVTTDLLEYFPYVDRMLPQVGFTRLILWEQYKEKYPEGVQYSRFCEAYSNWCAQGKGYVPI